MVRSKSSMLAIKADAKAIRALYEDSGVEFPPTCALALLVDRAEKTAERIVSAPSGNTTSADFFAAMHLYRIAAAVLPLAECANRAYYLERLASGELDFFKRVESDAKNVFWELEFHSSLRARSLGVQLRDPPDIVLPLSQGELGIACKKIYSEANFEKTLSVAVSQVKDFDVGIVALNLDELVPPDSVARARSKPELTALLQAPLEQFLQRHERHFRKYLSRERIVAAVAAIHSVADAPFWQPRFHVVREVLIWSFPDLSSKKTDQLEEFKRAVL